MTVDVPQTPPLAHVGNVELMHTGTWDLSTGEFTFTTDDLYAAVAALDCPAVRRPVLKLGHTDPRFDGEPAVGWVDNMAVAESGRTLVGDYNGMPGWLGDVIASAYPDRSIEGEYDYRCQMGHTHPFVVHAVALLGVVPPGIGSLESLQDVATLYGVAASAPDTHGTHVTVVAKEHTMPNPRPTKVAASVTAEDVMRAFYKSPLGQSWDIWVEEMQLEPLQLIYIDDATGARSRVPVTVGTGDGEDAVTFGDPVKVVIRYDDAPKDAGKPAAKAPLVFASRRESRGLMAKAVGVHHTATSDAAWDGPGNKANLSTDAGEATYRKAFAWVDPDADADTKAAWKFIHHEVDSDGNVGAASVKGCTSAIGVLNGGRGGSDIPDEDRQGVYNHLAAHLRDADVEPPALASPSAKSPAPTRAAGPPNPGEEPAVAFSDEQLTTLRQKLGTADDADEATILAALDQALEERADPPPDPPQVPEGMTVIETDVLEGLKTAAAAGQAAREQQLTERRDREIDAAIKAGKTTPARREHWQKAWQADPDGTSQTLASLAPGLVPTTFEGNPGSPDATADDALYESLFGKQTQEA